MTDISDGTPSVNIVSSTKVKIQNVASIIAPDAEAMQAHLDFLFGRALDGLVEISAIHVEKGRPLNTRFYGLDRLDAAIEFATKTNNLPGWNIYVGAALRREGTFPGKAATDADFLRSYVVWADADDADQVDRARVVYRENRISPPLVVVTGREPSNRAQLWWPLESPIEDIEALRAILRGVCGRLGTDPKVCTGKQLMRLGGSVSWPKPDKEGRILERTEIIRVAGAQQEFPIEQLARVFPPVEAASGDVTDVVIEPAGALGLTERVMDGRETYAFKLIRATLKELIGTTGSEPTADELYRAVAPVYLAKADQVRPGRGPDFLKVKVREALSAFERGLIPGAKTLDAAVINWANRHSKSEAGIPTSEQNQVDDEFSEAATEPPPFPASDFQGEPPERKWVVKDWIVQGTVNSLYGDGGLGKTLLAQQLACAVSLGLPWLGIETAGGSVLAVLCEDDRDELHRRHNDIKAAMGHTIGNPFHDVWLWPRVGFDNVLVRWDKDGKATLGKFAQALVDQVEKLRPSLLILDTLVDFYGGNEIDRIQVNYFVKTTLGGLIKSSPTPITVLLLGHPSVAGMASGSGFSGSTAWNNAVRSRLYLTKPQDGDVNDRVLTRGKANYAASGDETGLQLVYENGVLRPVDIVSETDALLFGCCQEVMQRVDRAWSANRPYMALKSHVRFIFKALPKVMVDADWKPDLVRQAIQSCIDNDDIFNAPTNGKRGYRSRVSH